MDGGLHPPYDSRMPNYRRLYVAGGTYFFTVNLADRSDDLLVRRIDALRAAYRETRTRLPFETIAMAVLPDHIHCLWRLPDGDHDFSTRWKILKREFSVRINQADDARVERRQGERGIWQRRFWEHSIRDEDDYNAHVDYIHFNPVKHGHVQDPDDWPYSTWHKWKDEYGKPLAPVELKAGE